MYPVVIVGGSAADDSRPIAINISKNVSLALAAASLSLKNHGKIDGDSWRKISETIVMKEEVQKHLGALSMAGASGIKMAVVPLARILEDVNDTLVQLYESKINESMEAVPDDEE